MATRQLFTGKHIFITGAGSGFGRATARRFAEEGAATVALVDLLPDRLETVATEVLALGARPVPIVCNVGQIAACSQAVARALDAAGRLDVVISNAAPPRLPEPFLEMKDETWLEDVSVMLTGSYAIGQRAARAMARSGGGSILFTASISALGAGRGFAAYCAAKAGIVALVRVMAVELAPYNIRVNAVSPGPADTPRSVHFLGEAVLARLRASFPAVPLNRLASVDDIANAFLHLASDEAAYVTGHNYVVDGGLTAQIYDPPRE